jgi:NTP pyrophosphatase (non-canonical NTP hydrolase)
MNAAVYCSMPGCRVCRGTPALSRWVQCGAGCKLIIAYCAAHGGIEQAFAEMQDHIAGHAPPDPFCPRHGRKSRPIEIPGLRCDCEEVKKKMTPNEYQKLALRTEHTPWIASGPDFVRLSRLLHAALGLCTEAGELQDQIKRHLMYGKDFDPTNVMEECGDLLWYIALALDATGYSLSDCMERNINKLRARYPEKFTSERALNRDLDAEREMLERGRAPDPYVAAAERVVLEQDLKK